MERRIQRAFLDPKGLLRQQADALSDAPAMQGSRLEHSQDQQIERALEEIDFWRRIFSHSHPR